MSEKGLVQQLIKEPDLIYELKDALPLDDAEAVKQHYETEADKLLWHKADESAAYANRLLTLAKLQKNEPFRALGLMKIGNALIPLGNFTEAWVQLKASQRLYLLLGDDVGWARTCIPMLNISPYLNQFETVLKDEPKAAAILAEKQIFGRLLFLKMNLGIAYARLGQFQASLKAYEQAIEICEEIPELAAQNLGAILSNKGISHSFLGNFDQADQAFTQATALLKEQDYLLNSVKLNTAHALTASGQLLRALQLAQEVEAYYQTALNSNDGMLVLAQTAIANIYLRLNRYKQVVKSSEATISQTEKLNVSVDKRILLTLTEAEAHLNHFDKAQAILDEAKTAFDTPSTQNWLAKVYLLRGQIAFLQQNLQIASESAKQASERFKQAGMQFDYASSRLLEGQVHFTKGDYALAVAVAQEVLQFARRYQVAILQYSAYLLLGKVKEALGDTVRAARYYFAGIATIERAQHALTITLRTGFIEDKQEATNRLMQLLITTGRWRAAFEVLERSKAQQWLSYLNDNQRLRWNMQDDAVGEKVERLNQLRTQYLVHQHRLQNVLSGDDTTALPMPTANIPDYLQELEHDMRKLLDNLYANAQKGTTDLPKSIDFQKLKSHLPSDTTLIAYYNDGEQIYAFIVNQHQSEPIGVMLPISVQAVSDKLSQFERNISRAMRIGRAGKRVQILKKQADNILSQLFDGIFAPLLHHINKEQRLFIVPYGDLHLLPFHLLRNKERYVVQDWQIVILPVATLITRSMEAGQDGALVLADTWQDTLPQTIVEAEDVHNRFGGDLYIREEATRLQLQNTPKLILHIATHAVAHLDVPHMSYLQLHDGKVYFDDLLQLDLRYELITLSACDTGKARVVPGDDVVGLGRNLLYAGAGSIVTSLWPAPDMITRLVMQTFYEALDRGMTKSAALQFAQTRILKQQPETHPAFWGAFQLIGDDKPLSRIHHIQRLVP